MSVIDPKGAIAEFIRKPNMAADTLNQCILNIEKNKGQNITQWPQYQLVNTLLDIASVYNVLDILKEKINN